jgi:hypothetical protein
MTDRVLACDLDGCITTEPLHWGGISPVGAVVWKLARRTGLAQRLMAKAIPNPLAVTCLSGLVRRGWTIRIVTAREECYRELTSWWLGRWQVPYDMLSMRAESVPVVHHKVAGVAGATLYLDDDAGLMVDVLRCLETSGQDIPVMVAVSEWVLIPRVIGAVERC